MKHLLPAVQRTALRIPWAAVGGCAAALLLCAAAVCVWGRMSLLAALAPLALS